MHDETSKHDYAVPLRSLQLDVTGKAEVVKFHRKTGKGTTKRAMPQTLPVEYKRGKPKKENYDKVQHCAQAMCLEEMLDAEIAYGALFYEKTRRRQGVLFEPALRQAMKNKECYYWYDDLKAVHIGT